MSSSIIAKELANIPDNTASAALALSQLSSSGGVYPAGAESTVSPPPGATARASFIVREEKQEQQEQEAIAGHLQKRSDDIKNQPSPFQEPHIHNMPSTTPFPSSNLSVRSLRMDSHYACLGDGASSDNSNNYNDNDNSSIGRGSSTYFIESREQQLMLLQQQQEANLLLAYSQDRINSLMAQDLQELSLEDLNLVQNDLHGRVDDIETMKLQENETLIQQLEDVIALAPPAIKVAYELANKQSTNYVKSLHWAFLRAERHNPEKAAHRLMHFFQQKRILFGDELLHVELTINDLNEQDKDCLQSGCLQQLPQPDRYGRPVLLVLPQRHDKNKAGTTPDIETLIRCYWFICMSTIRQNTSAQLHGMIGIIYNVGQDATMSKKNQTLISTISNLSNFVLPLRIASTHLCIDNDQPWFHPMVHWFRVLIGKHMRVRLRIHEGSHQSCQEALFHHGIDKESFPVSPGGIVSMEGHELWCNNLKKARTKKRSQQNISTERTASRVPTFATDSAPLPIAIEQNNFVLGGNNTNDIDGGGGGGSSTSTSTKHNGGNIKYELGPWDVPLGRGKGVRNALGYRRFHQLLDRYRPHYEEAPKIGKTEIAEQIIRIVFDAGGSFLKREDDHYVSVHHDVAREKVSHAFRTKRAKLHYPDAAQSSSFPSLAEQNGKSKHDNGDIGDENDDVDRDGDAMNSNSSNSAVPSLDNTVTSSTSGSKESGDDIIQKAKKMRQKK